PATERDLPPVARQSDLAGACPDNRRPRIRRGIASSTAGRGGARFPSSRYADSRNPVASERDRPGLCSWVRLGFDLDLNHLEQVQPVHDTPEEFALLRGQVVLDQ